ncbi:hypothetical protein SanaruYs_32620 [Chryseotalea sanaruensis]|uniref:Uncharacterized protein n=1 Tax=Chryseotalea sanaruensis TaxID=2482724 RepID=A0A401UDM2_9BACT|nr:hypothetical protein [Chryseotalea sanaruensis]GCC53021.1 hypothetical protein SanaruYs_32620 [Chryseotalea sanaruensis]
MPELFAQYESDKQATIPLEYFYVKKKKTGIPLLSMITFSVSSGMAINTLSHNLNGYGIRQDPGRQPVLFPATGGGPLGAPTTGNFQITNWFNQSAFDLIPIPDGSFQVSSDTAKLGFRSRGISVPIKASLHYEWRRFRIGGGISYEYVLIGDFRPRSFNGSIENYAPIKNGGFMRKYFGMAGVTVYRYKQNLLVADIQIGSFKPGRVFDVAKIQRSVNYNFGLTIEQEMSEYFRLFIRPSYDIKSFKMPIGVNTSINHRFNALYINVGATYRFPELRRCVIDGCRAQVNHAHGNKEYRSRMHPIYKKQNPYYGENHPTLIKYKGKNSRKLNPY